MDEFVQRPAPELVERVAREALGSGIEVRAALTLVHDEEGERRIVAKCNELFLTRGRGRHLPQVAFTFPRRPTIGPHFLGHFRREDVMERGERGEVETAAADNLLCAPDGEGR